MADGESRLRLRWSKMMELCNTGAGKRNVPLDQVVRSFRTYKEVLGARGSSEWLLHRLRRRLGISTRRLLQFHLLALKHPIEMRGGNSSDVDVFGQLFIGKEYSLLDDLDPRSILDLGANIGLSSAWFLSRFPETTLLAVEPEPDNFAICQRNLAPYGARAQALQAAVWPRRATLALRRGSFRDGREWTCQVQESESGEIQGWDIPGLMRRMGVEGVDLLKIDIERSEVPLFSSGTEAWLPYVRNICIELHDSECEQVFFRAMAGFQYDLYRCSDLHICRQLRKRDR